MELLYKNKDKKALVSICLFRKSVFTAVEIIIKNNDWNHVVSSLLDLLIIFRHRQKIRLSFRFRPKI